MKLYDFGLIAILVAVLIGGVTGAVIEDEKDLIKKEQSE